MLSWLIKNGKRILMCILVGMLLLTNVGNAETNDYCGYTIGNTSKIEESIPMWQQRECSIVIRPGEYANDDYVKEGKRVYVDDLNWSKIPTDIPIRKDNQGNHFISEHDINVKISKRLYQELIDRGVSVKYQDTYNRKEDLNAAGRKANESNPNIYLSIHTNSWKSDSSGYFLMYNPGDDMGKNIAQRLNDSISGNGMIPQNSNRENTEHYIGELSTLNKSTVGLLAELGYFSGTEGNGDLYYLLSDEYADYVAVHMADELVNVLNSYWD